MSRARTAPAARRTGTSRIAVRIGTGAPGLARRSPIVEHSAQWAMSFHQVVDFEPFEPAVEPVVVVVPLDVVPLDVVPVDVVSVVVVVPPLVVVPELVSEPELVPVPVPESGAVPVSAGWVTAGALCVVVSGAWAVTGAV